MNQRSITPEERYASLVEALRTTPAVTAPAVAGQPKKFGSTSLKINDRIFAMLVKEKLVLKLPAHRVEALIATG